MITCYRIHAVNGALYNVLFSGDALGFVESPGVPYVLCGHGFPPATVVEAIHDDGQEQTIAGLFAQEWRNDYTQGVEKRLDSDGWVFPNHVIDEVGRPFGYTVDPISVLHAYVIHHERHLYVHGYFEVQVAMSAEHPEFRELLPSRFGGVLNKEGSESFPFDGKDSYRRDPSERVHVPEGAYEEILKGLWAFFNAHPKLQVISETGDPLKPYGLMPVGEDVSVADICGEYQNDLMDSLGLSSIHGLVEGSVVAVGYPGD